MRIAVVCPYSVEVPGGVQGQAVGLVEQLRIAGHDAWLVAPGSAGPPQARMLGRAVNVTVNGSIAPIAIRPGTIRRVRLAIRDADVVHVHEPLVAPTSPAAFLGKGPPALGTFHADPSASIRRLYRLAGPGLRPILGRLGAVTAVSREAASAVDHLVDDLVHVPNAIDVAAFSTSVERNPNRVVFLGRDERRKGLDVLLAAWTRVSAAVPQAELVVLGADRATSEMGVRFLGTSLGREKRRQLGGASVFCAPNLGGESFGISLVEAMASGCAPVVSDLPAFRSVAGDAAVYVPVGDPGSLAGQLIDALSDPDRTRMRGRAAATAAAGFDWQHVIPTYLDIYARIAR